MSPLLGNSISIAEARRFALAAQQFGTGKAGPTTIRRVGEIVKRLGVIQIDSVNVLVRSHYLPMFSRFGAYDPLLLDRAAYADRKRTLVEYWGHEASFITMESWPLFLWRMEAARRGEGTWGRLRRYATEHQDAVDVVRRELRERGPFGASELSAAGRSSGGWWGWSEGKSIMEWLFWTGEVTTARRRNFERLYDLTERVIPADILNAPPPTRADAQRVLMTTAAAALGVATLRDLRDYFRLPVADAAARLHELVESKELVPVIVEGWRHQAYLYAQARCPRTISAATLLSPFDSLIWERQRAESLFDFHYRLEIYTPLHKRIHGYYVLPFLIGDRVAGRVDLKSDRANGKLLVRGGSTEAWIKSSAAVEPLRDQLTALAAWLGLESVAVTTRKGDLMKLLRQSRSDARVTQKKVGKSA